MFSLIFHRRISLIICLALTVVVLNPLSSKAADEPVNGADIVFLVDQSESMKDNDPLGLRFYGLQYAIEWLGRSILEYDSGHQYSFRVAVVDFGTYASQVLDPIEIAPRSEENWRDASDFLQKRLGAENRQEMGTTEIIPPFEKAAEIFAAWGSLSFDRQRIMILLTDGQPYPDSNLAMQSLEEYYTTAFPNPDYQLHVIGLSSANSPWPLFADRWDVLSHGQAQAVENRRLLGTHFQRILGQIGESLGIQAEQVTKCGMIPVAPYLDLVRFTVHNPEPSTPVKIFDASNQLVNDSATEDIAQFGDQVVEVRGHETPIEAITIYNPSPGNWRVECTPSTEGQPAIFVRQVSATSKPVMPRERLALDVPYAVTFHLEDHFGNYLAQDNDPYYALDVRLSAVASEEIDDRPDDVILRYDNTTQMYQGVLTPKSAGEWTYRLVARSATPDGSDRIVADITEPSVWVSHLQTVISLAPGRVGQLIPASLTLTLADAEGRPFVKTNEIFNTLEAEAIIMDGSQTITVPLKPADSGLYVGSFTPYASGVRTAQGRLYMLDPTSPRPILVAEGPTITQFTVEPVIFTPTLQPDLLTQLVPATIQLSLPIEQADALIPFRDVDLWIAQINGLGSYSTDITTSMPANGDLVLGFIPKSAGEFDPELILTRRHVGESKSIGTIHQELGSVRISPPQVITSTNESATESAKTCVLSARILDAAGQLFAMTMDQDYDLIVTAHDVSQPDMPVIPLVLDENGVHRSTISPTNGKRYLLKVEAQMNNETILLADGITLAAPTCGLVALVDDNRAWIAGIAALSIALLFLIALGVLLWRRRRSQPSLEGDSNPDTQGYVVLERPKGTLMASWNLSNHERVFQVWDPVEVIVDGKKVTCPVVRVEIQQSRNESIGETQTGKVGAHVTVFYKDRFDIFSGSRWIDESIDPLELKDGWWIAFRRLPGEPLTPLTPPPSGGEDNLSDPSPSVPPPGSSRIMPSRPRPDSDSLRPTRPTSADAPAASKSGQGAAAPSISTSTPDHPRPDSEDLATEDDA